MAGKVDTCLFDKTGTLTTDELVAVGVEPAKPVTSPSNGLAAAAAAGHVAATQGKGKGKDKEGGDASKSAMPDTIVPMLEAPPAATLVLAGCQSLVVVEGTEAGDPIEAAAMKAIKVRRW